jgi:hypothetical protein
MHLRKPLVFAAQCMKRKSCHHHPLLLELSQNDMTGGGKLGESLPMAIGEVLPILTL